MDNGIVDPYATHFSVSESKISLKTKKQKKPSTNQKCVLPTRREGQRMKEWPTND